MCMLFQGRPRLPTMPQAICDANLDAPISASCDLALRLRHVKDVFANLPTLESLQVPGEPVLVVGLLQVRVTQDRILVHGQGVRHDEMRSFVCERMPHSLFEAVGRVDPARAFDAGPGRDGDEVGGMSGRGRGTSRGLVDLVVEHDMNEIAGLHQADRHQSIDVHEHGAVPVQHDELAVWHRHCKTEADGRATPQGFNPEISIAGANLVPFRPGHQTVYSADEKNDWYRASITGNQFIVEFIREPKDIVFGGEQAWEAHSKHFEGMLKKVFGIECECDTGSIKEQKFGKIAPMDEDDRQEFIQCLTDEYNIYSLGRFATWRNLLLDDVVHDVSVIENIIKAKSRYNLQKVRAK